MSTLRSILVHLHASPRSAMLMRIGLELAVAHEATLTALYATTPSVFELPFGFAEGGAAGLQALQQLDDERREGARKLFDASAVDAKRPPQWQELHGGEPVIPGVTRHALCTDLLLFGQYDADDLQSLGVPSDFVASVLIASGKPALVVPFAGEFDRIGREVLIAWKPTREAARAVSCALPLLRGATRIHLSAEPEPDTSAAGPAALESYLRLHGIGARIERHGPVPSDMAGDGLLSLAADVGADLMVMGCYGHSRARELVLGGASRTVLKSMTLPVLMAH